MRALLELFSGYRTPKLDKRTLGKLSLDELEALSSRCRTREQRDKVVEMWAHKRDELDRVSEEIANSQGEVFHTHWPPDPKDEF